MPSSERLSSRAASRPQLVAGLVVAVLAIGARPGDARAETGARGFAIDRLTPSAAGAGWLASDTIDQHGGLGGAAGIAASWAHDPLRVTGDDGRRVAVIADQAVLDYSFAATYDRFRLSLGFGMPLYAGGHDATRGGFAYTAPTVDLGSNPDTLTDARLGFDVRVIGAPGDALRLGLGALVFAPNHDREDFVTDGTFRALFRVLFAGDRGAASWAGSLGFHARQLDEGTPGGPRGSELTFTLAAGYRVGLGHAGSLVIGPEAFGASAARHLFGDATTSIEALFGGRWEQAGDGARVRVKLEAGGGLHADFGAPTWRAVIGIELFHAGK
jgi:hypothetical protein